MRCYYLQNGIKTKKFKRLLLQAVIPLAMLCTLSAANAHDPLHVEGDVIPFLNDNFPQLPENKITISSDASVYAQYVQPTTKYNHGILGDSIEGEKLVVIQQGFAYTHNLSDQYVFEDIQPRLFDVDNDGELEFITIRSHESKGAGIMIYKIRDNALTEYAWVEEIGLANRWLNIAAIHDLDNDGTVEIAWIQTPHIGGVLKVADIKAGRLKVDAQISGYSNHAIGQRNLCLSVMTKNNEDMVLYVPAQNRRQIAGFQLVDKTFKQVELIKRTVDFSVPLSSQYDFVNVVQDKDFCAEK
jgi:hypothetical protein